MPTELDRLLRDVTLMTLAFAIALGWSLFQVAEGVETLVIGAIHRSDNSPGGLSFILGQHVFYFEPLLGGLVELAVVMAVILLVQRWRRHTARN
jgi:hypothetical protein